MMRGERQKITLHAYNNDVFDWWCFSMLARLIRCVRIKNLKIKFVCSIKYEQRSNSSLS